MQTFYTTRVVWCVGFYVLPCSADLEEQGCGVPHNAAYWIACVRFCVRCIKNLYVLLDYPVCQSPDVEP